MGRSLLDMRRLFKIVAMQGAVSYAEELARLSREMDISPC